MNNTPLQNLHCLKPLPRNSYSGVNAAMLRRQRRHELGRAFLGQKRCGFDSFSCKTSGCAASRLRSLHGTQNVGSDA